jgi:TonB family protein
MIWLNVLPPVAGSLCVVYRPGCQEQEKVNNRRRASAPIGRGLTLALISLLAALTWLNPAAAEDARKLKSSTPPEYPELAKRNNISGTARLQVVIAPDGSVKEIKVLGGNAVLVEAAVQAVRKWKYQPGPSETILILKFDFKPEHN